MPAIKPATREMIKAYLEVFIENLVNQHKARVIKAFDKPVEYLSSSSSQGRLKPFHAAIIPSQILRVSTFERSLLVPFVRIRRIRMVSPARCMCCG